MISAGLNIKSVTEPLKKVPVEYLYKALKSPKPEMVSRIDRLRIVRQMSGEQYSKLKQQLPYFVCATFNPPFRRTENFAYTEYFVVDIDHIGEKGLSISELKTKICSDPRTCLCFISPGQDGLKVIMKLSEKCYDPGIYSVFYKKFVYNLSIQYDLQQVIDAKTSDVARACFMSIDPDAYYNPNAETVDMGRLIPLEDTSELLSAKKDVELSVSNMKKDAGNAAVPPAKAADPDEESMARIRAQLDMKPKRQPVEKAVYIPEILNNIIDRLIEDINSTGLEVYEVVNIQYGKKIRAKLGMKTAEVNLFYGKKGFSAVISPKTGTNDALNRLLADAVESSLDL